MLRSFQLFDKPLEEMPAGRLLINTINAHSYNVARQDSDFAVALRNSEVLLPDGISVVWAAKLLAAVGSKQQAVSKLKKIAGEDLFYFEMKRLQQQAVSGKRQAAKAMFLGSTEEVLAIIKKRAAVDFPHVEVHTYSPPYKPEFSEEDNAAMYKAIAEVQPDVLFIGMTAPKQEKWAYKLVESSKFKVERQIVDNLQLTVDSEMQNTQYSELSTNCQLSTVHCPLSENCHVCCIGAVFDFYAGTVKRAPHWMIGAGMEWLYRLEQEPRRLWKRYLIGNVKFTWAVFLEVIGVI